MTEITTLNASRMRFNDRAVYSSRNVLKNKRIVKFLPIFLICMQNHGRVTRNNNTMIEIPRLKLEVAKQNFDFVGARTFNSFPMEIRLTKTFLQNFGHLFQTISNPSGSILLSNLIPNFHSLNTGQTRMAVLHFYVVYICKYLNSN